MYTVIGTGSCPYCTEAVKLLEKMGLPYQYVDITNDTEKRAQLKADGFKTVPVIYLNDALLGGFTELVSSFSN